MDIRFLLFLQELRFSANSLFNSFMLIVTHLATIGSALLCMGIYWAVDRILGYWLIFNCAGGLLLNSVIKLTACIYRPWIRDPSVSPHPEAMKSATGYSFPSGHTQTAASCFGSLALYLRDKNRGLSVFCIVMILLTGFSRVYLGVHTPQDVLAAMASSALLLAVNSFIFTKLRENPSLFTAAIAAGCAAAVLCIVYFTFKSYPADYVAGVLVVDPARMREDGYAAAGLALGGLAGSAIEVRFIHFSVSGTPVRRILRLVCGIPFAALLMTVIKNPVYDLIGRSAGHVVIYCLLALYIVAGYPAVFSAVQRKTRQDGR